MVNLSQINIRKLRQIRSARFSGSQLASSSFEQHSASTTTISSLILSISGTYKYFSIYEEQLFSGTYKYRYFSIYEEQLNDTVYRQERYGLPCTPTSFEKSLHTVQVLLSPEVFIVLILLNSWFSCYSLARRVYYLIHASFLRRVYYFKMHRLVYAKSLFSGTSIDCSVLKTNSFQNARSANCPSDK